MLASVLCGFVGTYIVTRRLVFISGGITHASFGGIGLGLFAGFPPILGAALFSVCSACGVQWLSQQRAMREDSAIATVWTVGMALGIVFTFLAPGFTPDLTTYLFGNILTVTTTDLWMLAILCVVVVTYFVCNIHTIIHTAFDRDHALARHLPVVRLEYFLMILIALTIVATLRMVGIVLVISLLTLPQMTANLFVHSFRGIIVGGSLIGFLSCLGGLGASYILNIPSGACIILVGIVIHGACRCCLLRLGSRQVLRLRSGQIIAPKSRTRHEAP